MEMAKQDEESAQHEGMNSARLSLMRPSVITAIKIVLRQDGR
jgi:hypothetical protein